MSKDTRAVVLSLTSLEAVSIEVAEPEERLLDFGL